MLSVRFGKAYFWESIETVCQNNRLQAFKSCLTNLFANSWCYNMINYNFPPCNQVILCLVQVSFSVWLISLYINTLIPEICVQAKVYIL